MDATLVKQGYINSKEDEKKEVGVRYQKNGKIQTADPTRERGIKIFLVCFIVIGAISVYTMKMDWVQLFQGISQIPDALSKLVKIDFSALDITIHALFESIAVAILATIYSLVGGMFLAVFMARNITPFRFLSVLLSAIFTFLRAIPSIIWVLLVLVCVGFGSTAGVIGMCISSTAFFAKCFAQCFEEVSEDTMEALRAMGAGKIKIFFRAVLPSAFTSLLAWTSISFENNFAASAVLGTVGAGGIGYVVANSMTRYAYGQAIVAIIIILLFTYCMEIGFTALKERNK
ncbi:PhnE/PtxC family ABC transporter permease [Anaerosporobacter sp.]|uniref:PhnE/PtxC family ABC transporter permease n=1 Tax=Anaerosporobacter sp. TaxID=1872529 RepID=UPI00286EF175|nr:ABC transporter permease subunit [Anaerosporobacter sp.]